MIFAILMHWIKQMDITQKNNRPCCIFSQLEKCRIYDQYSGMKLPLHQIPGSDVFICEDHYLKDKIDRWWYKHPKPENKPQYQEYPKCRTRAYPYFYFSKVVQECTPL